MDDPIYDSDPWVDACIENMTENPAVWDAAVAHDKGAWCDSCGRMKAYCTCNERL